MQSELETLQQAMREKEQEVQEWEDEVERLKSEREDLETKLASTPSVPEGRVGELEKLLRIYTSSW